MKGTIYKVEAYFVAKVKFRPPNQQQPLLRQYFTRFDRNAALSHFIANELYFK